MPKSNKPLIKIIPDRIKLVSEKTGVTLYEMADEIGVTSRHFYRTYRKGEINKSWLDVICSMCYIRPEFITGEMDTEVSFEKARLMINARNGLKDFIVARGHSADIIDNITDEHLEEIERDIVFKSKYPNESYEDKFIDRLFLIMKLMEAKSSVKAEIIDEIKRRKEK